MASVLRVNGQIIKTPGDFDIERYNITKSGRLSSGMMVMDLIAKKRKFLFQYEVLSGPEWQLILSLIDSDAMFFTLEYEEFDQVFTKTVYCGAIKYKRFRTDGQWYWKTVTFDLIER